MTATSGSASGESQKQSASGEKDFKAKNKAENSDEIQHFDTTIAKLVERENEETGETEWVEVMSDNLYPGERLKRADDEEKQAKKQELARARQHDIATKRQEADEEVLKAVREADKNKK
jgi:hypothetical protein